MSAPTPKKTVRILPFIHSVALAGLSMTAAAEVDTSNWNCEYCPFPDGYEADVEAGATSVSDDAARYGNATGYDESGIYANLDGRGMLARDAYRLDWVIEDLGLDSRTLAVAGGKPGSFAFDLGYREQPYRLFNTTRTVFSESGNDTLLLPSGWVSAARTNNMPGLAAALTDRNIESDRQLFDAGFELESIKNVSLYADYQYQQRDGVQIMGGSSFFQAALLPRIIDYETNIVDLGMRYADGPLSVAIGWYGSFFSNKALGLTWDNPFPGFEQGRLALEPDNRFQQLLVSATYRLNPMDSVISFSAATGRGEQDDSLLAYTTNAALSAPGLPRATLDGQVDTVNYALTLTSRPFPRARVKLSYRYDERDNQTPQAMWRRVVTDSFIAPSSELNIPYSFERSKLVVDGSYKLFDDLRLAGGYERKTIDRDFQEVAEQTEETGYGALRWRISPAFEIDVKAGTSRRDIDRYNEGLALSFDQNPLLRKYNLAYRYREFGEIMLNVTPAELPVSASVTVLSADDSYSRSRLGLLASDSLQIAADLSWTVSETVSAYLHASDETIEAEQAGSALFASPDWRATHDDDFVTVGAGLRVRNIGDKVDLTLDYTTSRGGTDIVVGPLSGVASAFPELESQFDDLRVTASIDSSERLSWNVSLRYQLFETEDWAIEGLTPDAAPSLLSLGAAPWDEDVFAIGIGVRYAIGAEGSE